MDYILLYEVKYIYLFMFYPNKFDLEKYKKKLNKNIKKILLRPQKDIITYDILDTDKSQKNKIISLKLKQYQMKIGEIWQEVLGSYEGFKNLKTGHHTGFITFKKNCN